MKHTEKQTETAQLEPFTRRQFLATSAKAAAGAALVSAVPRPGYTAESNTIKIVLVGCGGRGTGAAAQALSTKGPVKLWAMADFFPNRLQTSLSVLKQKKGEQADVPFERQFIGLDGYKKAIDSLDKGSVVLLATPPAFRPIHADYAVSKGMHVFMEKSFSVDGPGTRRIMRCGEEAKKKNLKIAGGLMSRHCKPLEEAMEKIHGGMIGEVIASWAYRVHGTVKVLTRDPSWNELAYQIANYHSFTWLNGSFFVDWLIHNIDVSCWLKNDWPVSVQGMGGRQVRKEADQLYDHYCAEYTFADGTRFMAEGRHIDNCWGFFGVQVLGATGCAVLGENVSNPRIFKGHREVSENMLWRYRGEPDDQYQTEHDLLFDAIRNDKPYNEAERCAKSCLTAIMGRMAIESGQMITFEEALNSNLELAPGLETMTSDGPPPVVPDADGHYPVAMPGQTKVL
jgi:myo-inositol 2-dehydrogenase / D-chiro-inositol 1-dehydrogenase